MEQKLEFVKHLRTVHFSLVLTAFAIIAATMMEERSDVDKAYNQLLEIQSALQFWDNRFLVNIFAGVSVGHVHRNDLDSGLFAQFFCNSLKFSFAPRNQDQVGTMIGDSSGRARSSHLASSSRLQACPPTSCRTHRPDAKQVRPRMEIPVSRSADPYGQAGVCQLVCGFRSRSRGILRAGHLARPGVF